MRPVLRAAVFSAAFVVPLLPFAAMANADTAHCTDHTTQVKVESDASPATVDVIDTRTGDLVTVVVTITGTGFTIESTDPSIELVDASWCVKSSTNTNSGSGTSGSSTSTNNQGVVQNISYVVVYAVTSDDPLPPPQPCDASTAAGGEGVTTTLHELGEGGPTAFVFDWEAFGVPDQFEVRYDGNVIFDTGVVGDNINEGTGSSTVNVPAGSATTVTVRVTGPVGTAWEYRVNCPV